MAGLTNQVPVQDSQAGAPLVCGSGNGHLNCRHGCLCVVLGYDILELQEMGRGAEIHLQKLWNGIGVFHYVG